MNGQSPDLVSWALELLTAGFVAFIGWALAILNRGRHMMEARVDRLEKDAGGHDTRLAVVQNCQVNTERRLTEITDTAHDTNAKIDKVIETLTNVLLSIKSHP